MDELRRIESPKIEGKHYYYTIELFVVVVF